MLMDTRSASIARVSQYTINIFYPKQPAVILLLLFVTKTALLRKPYPITLGKAKTSKPKQQGAITVSLPRNSIIFYKIWVKYISYAFFKCYMEIERKCYNSRYNFTQTEFICNQRYPHFCFLFKE